MLKFLKNAMRGGSKEISQPESAPQIKLPKLHGMTAESERTFLLNYCEKTFTGTGEIVDLGSWMGSLTIPILIGLERNKHVTNKSWAVHAYDIFTWADWMAQYYDKDYFHRPVMKAGDNFLEDFAHQVTPYDKQGRLVIHGGDLLKAGWNNHPIEMLIVDVMKSWELTNAVLKDFYTSLIPGVSQVFHQDFIHYYTPWIHLTHYRLREYFELVEEVSQSCTLVFRLKKKIPTELLSKTYSFSDFTDEEAQRAFEYSRSLVNFDTDWKRPEMAGLEAMYFVHQGKLAQAQTIIDEAVKAGVGVTHGLAIAQANVNASKH